MHVPRILVEVALEKVARIALPPNQSRHLIRVLRLRAGDPLILFNGDGRDFPARLLTPSERSAQVQIDSPTGTEPVPTLQIHLGVGVSKGERMDLVIQKAVELGANRISPLFTERSLIRLEGERLQKRQQHWRGVLVAACEQSGRRRLPVISPASSLAQWLAEPHPFPLLLDPRGTTALTRLRAPDGGLTLLAGPEGGLSAGERELASEAGFTAVHLGPRILRAETAPLAALAAAQALWGDFRAETD